MGGSAVHDAVAEAPGALLELQRHSILTWTEKVVQLFLTLEECFFCYNSKSMAYFNEEVKRYVTLYALSFI
jgi:hypothetical protein